MVLKRLFIGNLPENLTGDELSSKFSSFGNVQDVEVKTKNETTFGFVSLFVEEDKNLKHCIDVLNNTKWRGNLIKVQLAKESFMDRLKREQAENKEKASRPVGIISFEDEPEENSTNNMGALMTNYYKEVAQGKVKSLLPHLAAEKRKEEEEVPVRVAAAKEESVIQSKLLSLSSTTPRKNYSTTTNNTSSPNLLKNGRYDSMLPKKNLTLDNTIKSKKSSRKVNVSSDDDSDMEEAGHGLPPFRGLLAYPELNAPVVVEKKLEPILKIDPPPVVVQPIEKRLLQVVQSSHAPAAVKTPLNFKKRNSDQIRQKSMEARLNLNKNRSAMIKNSLLHMDPHPVSQSSTTTTAEPTKKKKRDKLSQNLFDDNDDTTEDVQTSFKVKPQFEGKSGQTNFELSSKFAAYDNRFVIDERFKDDKEEDGDDSKANLEQEKLTSFSILSDILGTSVTPNLNNKKTKSAKKSSNVIIQRYDPENDDDGEAEATTKMDVDESPIISNNKEKSKSKGKTKTTTVEEEVVEEPKVATHRVASNLTELFSSTPNSTGFSLLQTFGNQNGQNSSSHIQENNDDEHTTTTTKKRAENSFWQKKNPFKYDSSESENEDEKTTTTTTNKNHNEVVNGHDAGHPKKLPKKERFFFSKRDSRFEGVEDFFLKSTEDMSEVLYRFNNGERSELKLICKGKVKNTKRKSDKRMETLKRLKRKLKEKNKKKVTLEGSNAVPIGSK